LTVPARWLEVSRVPPGDEFQKSWKSDLAATIIRTDRSVSVWFFAIVSSVKEGQIDGVGSVWLV